MEMSAQQIATLWKQAELLKRNKKFLQAKKCYEDSLNLTDGLLSGNGHLYFQTNHPSYR
jgi:hypothetical protein